MRSELFSRRWLVIRTAKMVFRRLWKVWEIVCGLKQKERKPPITRAIHSRQARRDGHLKSYTLTARAGNFGYMNFYTDQSGVLRGTSEDRAATVQDRPTRPK